MHRIAVDLKRGYLRTKWWGEQVLRRVEGMTAARFDLMVVVREKFVLAGMGFTPLTRGVPQRELVGRLHVSKPTISKMLERLERLGWVRRERLGGARWREKMVFFTPLGLAHIAKAMRVMFRERPMLAYFERIFRKVSDVPRVHVVAKLAEASERIQFIADAFGDRSAIHYDLGLPLEDRWWETEDHREQRPVSELYVAPPPPPNPPPKPLSGDAREIMRPFTFTAYENAVRDIIWGTEKKRRRRKARQPE